VIYGSVCSGIEAASVAWDPLGWTPSFFSEIEPFPRSVLAHHFPNVPLHGDFTTIKAGDYAAIDLLVGGTPCQSFSVAGLRGGLADDRGNLALQYFRLAARLRPRWLVWENVPGVLSSNGGRDFGSILGGLVELGYGFAYRVLDAQHFRIPQRRRRVFLVGFLGNWRPAAAVLFERHSLQGHPAPRREAGQEVAGSLTSRASAGTDEACAGYLQPVIASTGEISQCLNAGGMGRQDYETETLSATMAFEWQRGATQNLEILNNVSPALIKSQTLAVTFSAKDYGADASDVAPTLRAMGHAGSHANGGGQVAVAVSLRGRDGGGTAELGGELANALRASQGGGDKPHVLQTAVRRLTPVECERLQGFPDNWTLVPHRGKPAADGPRYKAIGNSMAVPVMRWIGERIAAVEAITANRRAL